MKRREFIALLGGAAALAARGARAAAERMRRIGVLMPAPQTTRKVRPVSRRSCRGCGNWAGPMAATCGSIRDGARAAERYRSTRPNWSRSRRT